MKGYIGYIRVSTVKQGTKGVSLIEQRDAILRYAERMGFTITIWLEEMETAAKQGRPVFNQALKLLRAGQAKGIILHKLDRGARNLRDWAAIPHTPADRPPQVAGQIGRKLTAFYWLAALERVRRQITSALSRMTFILSPAANTNPPPWRLHVFHGFPLDGRKDSR